MPEDEFSPASLLVLTVLDHEVDVLEATVLVENEATLAVEGVKGSVEKKAVSESSISASAASLLVERVEGLGKGKVDDKADISLVDSKAKGDCGHNDLDSIVGPFSLSPGLLGRRNVCMVRSSPDSMGLDALSDLISFFLGEAVDDATWGLVGVFGLDELHDLPHKVLVTFGLGSHLVKEIGSVG